jgi:hypothetical protein
MLRLAGPRRLSKSENIGESRSRALGITLETSSFLLAPKVLAEGWR